MKFEQQRPEYSPIRITLETEREAKLFISLIDKLDWGGCPANPLPELRKEEYEIVKRISDAFTLGEFVLNYDNEDQKIQEMS